MILVRLTHHPPQSLAPDVARSFLVTGSSNQGSGAGGTNSLLRTGSRRPKLTSGEQQPLQFSSEISGFFFLRFFRDLLLCFLFHLRAGEHLCFLEKRLACEMGDRVARDILKA
jgi:hypothetical protein